MSSHLDTFFDGVLVGAITSAAWFTRAEIRHWYSWAMLAVGLSVMCWRRWRKVVAEAEAARTTRP